MKTEKPKGDTAHFVNTIINGLLKGGQVALTLELLARHSPEFIPELQQLMLKHSPNPITSQHIKNLFK